MQDAASLLRSMTEPFYQRNEYPALCDQAARWEKERPLAGLTVLDATPVFRNTLTKYQALLAAGATLLVGIDRVMPRDEAVVTWLRENGFTVVDAAEMPRPVDLVLDCAAAFSHWDAALGYVELTRTGVPKYEGRGKPVYLADSGRIKKIETCLGTGESYYRAMKKLGYGLTGKKIVIFGSGKVGTGLLWYAVRLGCSVTVVTRPGDASERTRALAGAVIDAADGAAISAAVQQADFVVTATGVQGAATSACPASVFNGSHAVLANMGVEDEYGAGVPADRVLEDKRPLNFILDEPTLIKYIDATMALHNEGALFVKDCNRGTGLVIPPRQTEERLLAVSRENGILGDELGLI